MVQAAFVPRQPNRDDAAIQDNLRDVSEQDALVQGRQAIRRGAYPAEIMNAKQPMTVTEMARLGGYACAKKRTPAERTRIARKAVQTRWKRYRERQGKA